MADFVTRCPKCSTSFKLTIDHLKTAKGAVRCGSCLNVFKANEHWATPLTPEQERELDTVLNPAPAGADFSLGNETDEDDILISDDMDGEETPAPPSSSDSLFGDELSAEFRTSNDNDGKSSSKKSGFSASAYESNELADESWADGLLDDNDDAPSSLIPPANTYSAPKTNQEPTHSHLPEPDTGDDQWSSNIGVEDDHNYNEEDLFNEDDRNSRHQLLSRIEPEPVQFQTHRARSPLKQKLLWGSLCLLAGAIGFLQFGYWKMNDLARQAQWRPSYEKACDMLNCKLPTLIDIQRMRSHNLIVRSHPDYENALLVDTIVINTADFPQPFPKLQLVFSDLQNKTVASRQFSANEYLAGELAGATMMPPHQPIHLGLEIVDPGEQAVSYRLEILP
ncbi:MAG: DUF3426 domain-containing protein [Cellvibrionaceae bacterium]